jgi:hypothetical protein
MHGKGKCNQTAFPPSPEWKQIDWRSGWLEVCMGWERSAPGWCDYLSRLDVVFAWRPGRLKELHDF